MTTSILEVRSLSVGYAGRAVLTDLDFALEKGRILSVVGPNGSGKTTLLKTIASLLPPLAGEIRVLGAAPGTFGARVAYLGQVHPSGYVLSLRAIDVVRMARSSSLRFWGRAIREDERRVLEAMEHMRISELRNERLEALSAGQRQRVFVAQAFARGAELLVLDEPVAGLDRRAREIYRKVLQDAADVGCSAVVGTRDIEQAACSDLALLLAQRVVTFGRASEVLTAKALLSTFGLVARYGKEGVLVFDHHRHGDLNGHYTEITELG